MNKKQILLTGALALSILGSPFAINEASASSSTHIGSVKLVEDVMLYKKARGLGYEVTNVARDAGTTYRVYSITNVDFNNYLSVGGGYYILDSEDADYTPNPVPEKKRLAVKWNDSTLVEGQIGRVTLSKDLALYKLEGSSTFIKSDIVRPSNSLFRVYSYKLIDGQYYYGVGGGYYFKAGDGIKYETPALNKQRQLKNLIISTMVMSRDLNYFYKSESFGESYSLNDSIEYISEDSGYPIKLQDGLKVVETPIYTYYQKADEDSLYQIKVFWMNDPTYSKESVAQMFSYRGDMNRKGPAENELMYSSMTHYLHFDFDLPHYNKVITYGRLDEL
ncbi:hypothetical protein [Jeotgalibacillus sp. R-1-5s-1]|uniref:hypothetical protein n=1 Tax=Jeotgalibacillus sp. R-1-5s-1 TaxID=2555897 RepID=UPI00106A1C96|nr:hypothetical protein [Jeotgalibacillus sp. R-1-5s-1]TFD97084.1 hypothetical protein E2491_10365 [Jeotgalibacillus sp. R-1-5s-1]